MSLARRLRGVATLLVALGVVALSVGFAVGSERMGGGLSLPYMLSFYASNEEQMSVAVLENGTRSIKTGVLLDNSGKVSNWQGLPGIGKPLALAGDETGLLLVVSEEGGEWFLRRYRDGKLLGFEEPLEAFADGGKTGKVVGAAARSGILWLIFRDPVGIGLYAYDGALLARAPVERIVRAPFSVAVGAGGEAYVTDPLGPAVVVYSGSGGFETRHELAGTGVTRPTGIAVDQAGVVWLSDGVTGRVVCMEIFQDAAEVGCRDRDIRVDDPLRLASDPSGAWGVWALEGRGGNLMRVEDGR